MKLAIASDLHFEFGPIVLNNDESADVLILAGDTIPANFVRKDRSDNQALELRNLFATFLGNISKQFKHVIMIAGNHEHYHYRFEKTIPLMKSIVVDYPNIHFLEKEAMVIDDITFIGATLWTDFNRSDPTTMNAARYGMNDYRIIQFEDRRLSPDDVFKEHIDTIQFISSLAGDIPGKIVVVGHHAPSNKSTHPRYANDYEMNGSYSSNLENFIMDNQNIELWIHGHTHTGFDYEIGNTRIVCNPRGYIGHEPGAESFKLKYVEV